MGDGEGGECCTLNWQWLPGPLWPQSSLCEHCSLTPLSPCPPGVYMHSYDAGLNVKNGFPVFSTCLEANYVQKREDVYSLYSLTDEDKVSILELARDPRIGETISLLLC